MNSSLSSREAVGAWIGRALGLKVRDLVAKFDVDPRRLYDVWKEETHPGSREIAERLFELLFPNRSPSRKFERHQERFKRMRLEQLDLFSK